MADQEQDPGSGNPQDENACLRFIKWLTSKGIDGMPGVTSAHELAQEYLKDAAYPTVEKKIDALIRWEVAKCASSGFITGLGGFLTLPVTVPAGLAAAWIVEAQMVAAMAEIAGAPFTREQLVTVVLLCICGEGINQAMKQIGVQISTKTLKALIQKIPGKVLIEINKKVGFRLLTKAGEKGIINLMKAVPVFGGVVGAAWDGMSCSSVGKFAKKAFLTQS
ncbi:MAG TPA: EcsC family protein [Candidatus Spyradenecus faecavium]|uniref:EcsC family protein n=1 Tax=Candidatus Spyradenecus faecavium TaxID=2840947 RepID=A0A9D1T3H1_9BACT|nr:EcsC family protein [Candidatus Spyradenecus faecavium]